MGKEITKTIYAENLKRFNQEHHHAIVVRLNDQEYELLKHLRHARSLSQVIRDLIVAEHNTHGHLSEDQWFKVMLDEAGYR